MTVLALAISDSKCENARGSHRQPCRPGPLSNGSRCKRHARLFDKSIIGMLDQVGGVASDAARRSQEGERFLVRALLENLAC